MKSDADFSRSVPVPDAQQVIADALQRDYGWNGLPNGIAAALAAAGLLLEPDEVSVPREALAHVVGLLPDNDIEDAQFCKKCQPVLARLNGKS